MNTEHTNQPKQAAEAAFEQWWQRHGLTDPMDDEDRQYATASSWARRGYLAAMGLATIKDSLTADRQAEPVAYLKTAAGVMQLSFEGNPVVNVGADVEVQADMVEPLYAQPPAAAVPDEVAKDAARYRWLRQDESEFSSMAPAELDAAIDKAIAAAQKGGAA